MLSVQGPLRVRFCTSGTQEGAGSPHTASWATPNLDPLPSPGELGELSTGVALAPDGQTEGESCPNSGPTLPPQDAKTDVD